MTAGTVVITGGILATVILLCIIAVLCYCRLQYYCCKKNELDGDTGSSSLPQFACNACSAPGLDGAAVTPLSLSAADPAPARSYCPTCSPYGSPFYVRTADETRNGGERVTYMPAHYENPALSLTLSSLHSAPLTARNPPDFYANTRAISTEV
ncbi:protein FAM163A [Conger conger]|uniref:protein FAM163A n=1 Tax=Conger conger TaxID=82655 RepID=UPI002A5AF602|nr:protein FAM163A [Conger conger]